MLHFRMQAKNKITTNLSWRELYRAALLEVVPERLRERIDAAERAIRQRSEELKGGDGQASEEQTAMADALRALRVLAQSECPSQGGSTVNAIKGEVAS
ncbi:MAG: hypothetical protein WB711_02800 [Terriglobales bacterium]